MNFGQSYNKYEQIDEFQLSKELYYSHKHGCGAKYRVFRREANQPLQKKTYIKISAFEDLEYHKKICRLERELWHQYEVPQTPTSLGHFYTPNLFDHVFANYDTYVKYRGSLLKQSEDAVMQPVPLYQRATVNKNIQDKPWMVLDGRVYGGIDMNPMLVTDPFQMLDNEGDASKCEKFPLPIYRKGENPRSFEAMWDMNDGLSVYVGMEVELNKPHQSVEGHPTITNKVTKKSQEIVVDCAFCSDFGSLSGWALQHGQKGDMPINRR